MRSILCPCGVSIHELQSMTLIFNSGNSYNFIGVGAGVHTIYVKRLIGEKTISEVHLMNIPKNI